MKFQVLLMQILEVAFFVGLAGCASTVLISWVVVLKESFSKDK